MTAFQDSPAVYLKLVDVSYGSAADDQKTKICLLPVAAFELHIRTEKYTSRVMAGQGIPRAPGWSPTLLH